MSRSTDTTATIDRATPAEVAGAAVAARPVSSTPVGPDGDADRLPTLVGFEDVADFAAELGIPAVTVGFVRQSHEDKKLPSFRIGGKLHYSRADVRDWLMSLRRG